VHYAVVATMDADLQNDPADLPEMMGRLGDQCDFVQGRRQTREDPWLRRVSSRIANAVRRRILNDSFSDIGCSLRVFRKECMAGLQWFDGAHRFLPVLVQREGFRVVECNVKHHPRVAGVSKYNIRNRMFKSLRDLFRVRFGGGGRRIATDKMKK
jgi:hypothetical protein